MLCKLKPIALAREDARHGTRFELVNDPLYADIGTQSEEHGADEDDDDVQRNANIVSDALAISSNLDIGIAHAEIGHRPEDEAKPAVEEGRHDRENCARLARDLEKRGYERLGG